MTTDSSLAAKSHAIYAESQTLEPSRELLWQALRAHVSIHGCICAVCEEARWLLKVLHADTEAR